MRFTSQAKAGKIMDTPSSGIGPVVAGVKAFMEWVRRERIPRKKAPDMARWNDLAALGPVVKRPFARRIAELTVEDALRRKLLAYGLKRSTPLMMKQMAGMVGMRTVIAVTQVVRRLEIGGREDASLGAILAKLDRYLRKGQRWM